MELVDLFPVVVGNGVRRNWHDVALACLLVCWWTLWMLFCGWWRFRAFVLCYMPADTESVPSWWKKCIQTQVLSEWWICAPECVVYNLWIVVDGSRALLFLFFSLSCWDFFSAICNCIWQSFVFPLWQQTASTNSEYQFLSSVWHLVAVFFSC